MKLFTLLNSYKKNLFYINMLLCLILCAWIVATSLPYGSFNRPTETLPFSHDWDIYSNGSLEAAQATLPYTPTTKSTLNTVDLYNTIPKTDWLVTSVVLPLFQKDVWVYIDDVLIYEKEFQQLNNQQTSPGSGVYYITLPTDSAGKEIHIQIGYAVASDRSNLPKIKLQNALINQNYQPILGPYIFVFLLGIFIIAMVLFVIGMLYFLSGAKASSMVSLSVFFFSASLWVLCNSKILQYFTDNTVLIHNLEYISFYVMPLSLWIYFWRNWGLARKIVRPCITVMSGFLAMTLVAKAFGLADFFLFLPVFHLLCISNMVAIIAVIVTTFKCASPSLRTLYLGLLTMVLFSAIDLVRYYLVLSSEVFAVFYVWGLILLAGFMLLSFVISSQEQIRMQAENKLYKTLAMTDSLTKMNSRIRWEQDMTALAASAHSSLIFTMLDINGLKQVNDSLGHAAGDLLIQIVASTLYKVFTNYGMTYRIGGDEFCIITLTVDEASLATLLSDLDRRLAAEVLPFPVSASHGFCKYNCDEHACFNDALKIADQLMYQNKRQERAEQ